MIERHRARLQGALPVALATLAVVGVLVMHGVGPTTIGGSRGAHHAHTDHDTGDRLDVALDLCTFMTLGMGLAALALVVPRHRFRRRPTLISPLPDTVSPPSAGRARLLRLCVVRV